MLKNLPWTSHEEKPPSEQEPKHEEQSLTSILETPELRGELTLLINNSTESMRQILIDTFDPEKTGQPSDETTNLTGDDALRNPNVDPGTADVEAAEKERKERELREKELSAPKMQELKADALRYFDDWRDSVIIRVGGIINAKDTAQKQQKEEATAQSPESREKKVGENKPDEAAAAALKELYPPIETPLVQLEEKKRALVLHSLLLILLGLEHYSAHSRILLLRLSTSLNLSIDFLAEHEAQVARGLLEAAQKDMNADEETKKKAEENKTSRKWKVGLASVAGAAVIGITGGLAAPLLAAGLGSVMGGLGLGATAAAGYLGTLAGSSVLVGGLFGAYGARMTGQMMDAYAKEVSDFAFIPVKEFHRPRKIEKEFRRLRIAIGISGWLTSQEEVVAPWRIISPSIEGFALRWELEALMSLGNSLTTMVKSAAWSFAKSEIIKRTIFASLTAGLWPIGLLKVSRIIDNPFSVARSRSEKAGQVLADALINKAQGERPVTLIGYSLGARVIYTCLQTLADRKAFGLVESVVLLGAPTPSTPGEWRRIRSVVSGRVVNVFSAKDYILAFLYRTSSIQYGIAGLQKIAGVPGIENIDVSDLVSGHTRYRYLTGRILKKIGFEDIDVEEVEREEVAMEQVEEQEEEQRRENEKGETKDEEGQAEAMEREVEEKNQRSMAGWAADKMSAGSRALGFSKGEKEKEVGKKEGTA